VAGIAAVTAELAIPKAIHGVSDPLSNPAFTTADGAADTIVVNRQMAELGEDPPEFFATTRQK
jgi:hypothetical protein